MGAEEALVGVPDGLVGVPDGSVGEADGLVGEDDGLVAEALGDGDALTVVFPDPLTWAEPPLASGQDTEALPSAPVTLWHWLVDRALARAWRAAWSLSFAACLAFTTAACWAFGETRERVVTIERRT